MSKGVYIQKDITPGKHRGEGPWAAPDHSRGDGRPGVRRMKRKKKVKLRKPS